LGTAPTLSLVPKLQLGNRSREAPASSEPGSWSFQNGITKLELGNEEKLELGNEENGGIAGLY
jgi:hypothetical protein